MTFLDCFISIWRIMSEMPPARSFFVREPSLEIYVGLLAFELGLMDLSGGFPGERDNYRE